MPGRELLPELPSHARRAARRAPPHPDRRRGRRRLAAPRRRQPRRSVATMRGDDEIIELLNEVLTGELTAINQYFVHAKMCDNWGYERLAEKIRDESIDEMKHAEELIERILYLEGVPNLQRLGTVRVGETVPEQLRVDLGRRAWRSPASTTASPSAVAAGDNGSRELLEYDPHRRGGARRLAGDAARDDPPDRHRELPRPAVRTPEPFPQRQRCSSAPNSLWKRGSLPVKPGGPGSCQDGRRRFQLQRGRVETLTHCQRCRPKRRCRGRGRRWCSSCASSSS